MTSNMALSLIISNSFGYRKSENINLLQVYTSKKLLQVTTYLFDDKDILRLYGALSCTKVAVIYICSPFLRADVKVSCHLGILRILNKLCIACLEKFWKITCSFGDYQVFLQSNSHARFTPRAVARVMHGIASPAYPYTTWGRTHFWWVEALL